MATRNCLACERELTGEIVSLEHAIPQWLAKEIELPGVSLRHFVHDECKADDALIRSHQLNTFGSKKICRICNNGWMSSLESAAKPLILDLMHGRTSILALTDVARLTLSRWAVKTTFMIAVLQTIQYELPWTIFQMLGKRENDGPNGCFVFGTQQPGLPKGFLHTCLADLFSEGQFFQVRVGFSVHQLHFVVVIPIVKALRAVKTSGMVHVPLWPLDLRVLATYKKIPESFESSYRFNDYLTNLVEAGAVSKNGVHLEVIEANPAVAV
jgi:hypothetical protein